MRHAWCMKIPSHVNIRPILACLLANQKPTVAEMTTLKRQLGECDMDRTLRRMIRLSIRRLMDIGDRVAFSTCTELLAGMDYAQCDAGVGSLRHLRRHASKDVAKFLREECARFMHIRAWRHRDAWFMLRVICMDAYALARVLDTKQPAVYYAGKAHTNRLLAFLQTQMHAARTEMPASFRTIARDAGTFGILHVECVEVKGRPLLILGENHQTTDVRFASHMLTFLRDACNTLSVDVFIEKHLSNAKDPLQCELMCNQPHIALHRIRCDEITASSDCANLAVVPVDNRHADLGFLRTEILDMWTQDDAFKRLAMKFQKTAIEHMQALCDTLA